MPPRTAMEPSGPCGFDRPDTSSTSSETAPPVLPCNIEAKAESNGLANWHVACCSGCMRHKQWALCGGTFWREAEPVRLQWAPIVRLWNSQRAKAKLTISSKYISMGSLRGRLLIRFLDPRYTAYSSD